jgi:hypothetical protein
MQSWARTLARSPGWQLVLGGVLLALAFPSRLAGTAGLAIVAGALGIAAMLGWPRLPDWLRAPPAALASAIVIAIVVAFGVSTFWDTMTVSPDWQMGDWGPQHAVLRRAMSALPGLELPVWNQAAGTGDAPFELYPKLAYLVTGHTALLLGLDDDLPLAMMIVAVLVHIAIAVATTLLAARVAPRPIALVVGLLTVVDSGAVAHGGTVGLFHWALLHSALALAFATAAALGVIAALRKPRLPASALIWVATALACATHPAGLIAAAAGMVALLAVALLANDVPPRRALAAFGHLGLGVALGAFSWMPLAARILAYGQHFPNPIRTPGKLLEDLLANPSPVTAFGMLGYAGYFGILAGLWSRRAAQVFVAAAALVLLVGLCDAPYLGLDLAPGLGTARLGTERLAQLARPFLAAAGAYGIAIVLRSVRDAWRGASRNQRLVAAALAGVLGGVTLRALPALYRSSTNRAYTETRVTAADPIGRELLIHWAHERMKELGPERWARALFDTDTHEHFHLTAETGLPTLHNGPQPDLLLRERIEDTTPESLRRFDVRWAIASDHSPDLGDPDSEVVIGSFHIRELRDWDGKFARVERGTGSVRTLRLDDAAVEVEVTGSEPVLVALGTGYYPRWRARHASGAAEPVYACPATPTGTLHVPCAWLAPGRSTFTVDGPLPSDHAGRWLSLLALAAAIAAVVTWRVRRWRVRVLRKLAAARAWRPALAPLAVRVGVPLVLVVLLVRGCRDAGAPARALVLGDGIRGTATVEARVAGGEWQECGYQRIAGDYECDQVLVAYDGMTALLNDAYPSWGFNTPGIVASANIPGVEMRVHLHERLAGTYWMAVSEGTFELALTGEHLRDAVDRQILTFDDIGEREIAIRAAVPVTTWSWTFVREDTLVPPRDFLAAPPLSAPDAIRAIR